MRIGKWIIDSKDEIEFKDDYAVEKDGGETRDVITTYDTTSEVTSWTDFLTNHFVSGTRLGKWFRDFKEGCNFLLHLGSIVNNCTTEDDTAVLSATQGKVLMDLIELQDKTIKEQAEKIDNQETEISDLNNSLKELKADLPLYFYSFSSGTYQALTISCTKRNNATFYVTEGNGGGYTMVALLRRNGSDIFLNRGNTSIDYSSGDNVWEWTVWPYEYAYGFLISESELSLTWS